VAAVIAAAMATTTMVLSITNSHRESRCVLALDGGNEQSSRHRLANFTAEHHDPHRSAGSAMVAALVPVINRQCENTLPVAYLRPSSLKITSV